MASVFKRVAAGLDIGPALYELSEQPKLWLEITARQDYPGSAHKDTQSIFLRGPKNITAEAIYNEVKNIDYPTSKKLPQCVRLLEGVYKDLRVKQLGRVMAVKLLADGYIYRHIDEGIYADHYQRFHLVLQSDRGNIFECGEDYVYMKPGECWWFDHKSCHDVYNGSTRDRIHLIFDAVLEI